MKVRIKFAKSGAMKFIGHLDIMRYFQKALRRAKIDIAYSAGFSPHQIMSFAAPLGVGLTSEGEYLDIEVHSVTSSEDMKQKLNAVMVDGMEIVSIRQLPDTIKNAMASVAAANYFITFREGCEPAFDWKTQLLSFCEKPEIKIIKQTKKSEKELDLKPFIFSLEEQDNGIVMLVNASSAGNIKPTLVLEAFYQDNQQTLGEFDLEIKRLETYGYQETEHGPELLSLEKFGNEF